MIYERTTKANKTLIRLAYAGLAVRCGLEWLATRDSLIANPLFLIVYVASFLVCLIVATLLWVQRSNWLSEARIAATLLLLSLLWSLF